MNNPLLEAHSLCKAITTNHFWRKNRFYAVDNVSFTLERGQTLSITGYNGSGKSTLAKMLVGIVEPSSGTIFFRGKKLIFGDYKYRTKHIRMVFQDIHSSLNPKLNIGQILDFPLRLNTELNEQQRNEKIFNILKLFDLHPDHVMVKIGDISISQKQKIALARAIILEPEIVILDDAINTLDYSTRVHLVNLSLKLQQEIGTSYIYVGQHLGIIKHISDNILVMNEGKVCEFGDARTVLSNPQNIITKRLVESYLLANHKVHSHEI